MRVIGQREVAEELTQDILIKCIEKIQYFEGKSKLKTWVYTIAHNASLNYLRKNQLKTIEIKDEITGGKGKNETAAEIDKKDTKKIIDHYFRLLASDQKELLTLFYLEELSLKEIAEITDNTPGNVRVKLYRAREQFKCLLSKNDITLLKELRHE